MRPPSCLCALLLAISFNIDSAKAEYTFTRITDNSVNQFVRAGSINNVGQVAFWTQNSSGRHAIGLWNQNQSTITDVATAANPPGGSGDKESLGRQPGINNLGHVAYEQTLSPSPGTVSRSLKVYDGGSTRTELSGSTTIGDPLIADTGRIAFAFGGSVNFRGGGGPNGSFGTGSLIGMTDSGKIAFGQGRAIKVGTTDSDLEEIPLTSSQLLSRMGGVSESGTVAFRASDNTLPNDGVNIYTGVVNQPPVIIAGAEDYGNFSSGMVSINNSDTVMFVARGGSTRGGGLYTTLAGLDSPVLAFGDSLDGGVISALAVSADAISDTNDITFWARFEDGREALYYGQFTAVPEPNSILTLVAANTMLVLLRRRRA